jgi:N-acetylmuramoyl-L-alanine amidase
MKNVFFTTLLVVLCALTQAQTPFIRLVQPTKETNNFYNTKQYISGATCKGCTLNVNGTTIKVYSTGAFAFACNLANTDSTFVLTATNPINTTATKTLQFKYTPPTPDTATGLRITDFTVYPEGNLYLSPGEQIAIKVKATPNCTVSVNGINLYELPSTNKNLSTYQANYTIKPTDSFFVTKWQAKATNAAKKTVVKTANTTISMFSNLAPNIAKTKGRLAHLLFGLGEDRLGGAKIGYIDSAVLLNIIGKMGSNYKVQLSKYKTAFVPDDVVTLMPKGTFVPNSLTSNWRVYADSLYDYVTVSLTEKLPYQSLQEVNPNKIIVDVFGATNNTNWITRLEKTAAIANVSYEQVEDEIFRIKIDLKQNHWGHDIFYKGNALVIRIKQKPKNLQLANLTFGIDAGHGGSNTGAGGPTNSSEKVIALQLAQKMQQALQAAGAKVIMSRTSDAFFDNKERILFYRDNRPDLLLSFHLNSSADPVNVKGTSVFYRYEGFRNFGNAIYQQLLTLGFTEYGNNSSFNFMLNSPTEYPNALIESAFISHPEDEEKMLDENFQWQFINKIVVGIKAFLEKEKTAQ